MTRTRFVFSACLVFGLLGPLAAVAMHGLWMSVAKGSTYWQGGGWFMLLGYSYLSGMLQALLYGLLCGASLLVAVWKWPSLTTTEQRRRMLLLAQMIGLFMVLLLQGPSLIARSQKLLPTGSGFWSSLANVWNMEANGVVMIGVVPFVAWYLVPTLVCMSVIVWRLVPRLKR